MQTLEMGPHGQKPLRNVSRPEKIKTQTSYPNEVNRNLHLISKLDQDQKTLGYLYCSVMAGEGISWPQRVVTLIPSALCSMAAHIEVLFLLSWVTLPKILQKYKRVILWHLHRQILYFYRNAKVIRGEFIFKYSPKSLSSAITNRLL